MILHSKPWITEEDKQAVLSVLSKGMLAQGSVTKEFESGMAQWSGAKSGIAVSSGAGAIYLSLLALGIKTEDEVILPTYVCESVLQAVTATGAKGILCDVGINWVMEVAGVEKIINSKTKAIIVPHMYGIFADIASFRKFGAPVIEDCAQAVGDREIDKIKGDIAVFSFHPTKCFTSGEGGMMVTSNEELARKARNIRDGSEEEFSKRFLSPMSDLQAALGLSQLNRYPAFIKKRSEIAGKYMTDIAAIDQKILNYEAASSSMFFRFPIKINGGLEKYKPLFEEKGIHIRKGVDKLLHRLTGKNDAEFPVATELFNTTISVPIYPAMNEEEIKTCCDSLTLLQ